MSWNDAIRWQLHPRLHQGVIGITLSPIHYIDRGFAVGDPRVQIAHVEIDLEIRGRCEHRFQFQTPGLGIEILINRRDRKSVVSGNSVSVRVDLGGRRYIKTKTHKTKK